MRRSPAPVAQAGNGKDGHHEVQGGSGSGCKVCARLVWMIIDLEGDMQSVLDIGDVALDIEHDAIRVRDGDGELMRPGPIHDGLVIGLGRAELLRELGGGQPLPKLWAGRVIEFLEQT
jgi:hypothetical protein